MNTQAKAANDDNQHPEGTRPFTPAQMAMLRRMRVAVDYYLGPVSESWNSTTVRCLIDRGVVQWDGVGARLTPLGIRVVREREGRAG